MNRAYASVSKTPCPLLMYSTQDSVLVGYPFGGLEEFVSGNQFSTALWYPAGVLRPIYTIITYLSSSPLLHTSFPFTLPARAGHSEDVHIANNAPGCNVTLLKAT